MHRTAEEITMRCKFITGNDETAKAARWLGVLRRDYPDRYAELTHNILCHVPRNTARKGEKDEKGVCS